MAFGDSAEDLDEVGHWVTIPYNGQPFVKMYFPVKNIYGKQEDLTLAIFWRGWAQERDISRFLNWCEVIYREELIFTTSDDQESDVPDDPGRIFISMLAQQESPIEVWADLQPDRDGAVTSEVGVRLGAKELQERPLLPACKELLQSTISIDRVSRDEVDELFKVIEAKIFRHYKMSKTANHYFEA